MASAYGIAPIYTPEGEDVNANQSTLILSVSVVLIVVPTCIVFLRFVARLLSKAGLWWDDWLVLLGLLLALALSSLQIYSLSFGFGEHIAAQGDLITRLDVAQYWFKLFYAYEHIYTFSVFCCKMSILLFYSRIFKERRFIFWMRCLIVITVLHFLSGELAIILECIPIQALWDPSITDGRCIDIIKFFDAHGAANAVLDLAILTLPLPWIWSLEIERHHKWALSGVFMLGSLVVIAAVVRVVVLSQLTVEDITWEFVNGALWTAAEPSIAVTSASLPILRSLWIWNRRKSSQRYGGDTPDSYVESNKNTPGRQPGFQKMSSLRGNSPVNELPAGVQHAQGFGNHVTVGAGTYQEARKLSDEDHYKGLPIMHPQEAAYSHRQQQQSQTWRPQRPAYAAQPPSERHQHSSSIMSPHRSMSSQAQSIQSPVRNSRSTLLSNNRSTANYRSELSGN